jgi:hypothetical protein
MATFVRCAPFQSAVIALASRSIAACCAAVVGKKYWSSRTRWAPAASIGAAISVMSAENIARHNLPCFLGGMFFFLSFFLSILSFFRFFLIDHERKRMHCPLGWFFLQLAKEKKWY